jgi:hypothetical protein
VTADGTVVVRSNLRQGRFQTISLGVENAMDLAVADLDGDGLPDVVVAGRGALVFLANRGEGKFERLPGGDLARLPAAFSPRRVFLADLDNDGFPDVIVGGESGLAVWRNAGMDTFTAWPIAPRGLGRVDAIAVVDSDGDGDLDIAVSDAGRTRLFENEGGNANNWLDVRLEGLAAGSGAVKPRWRRVARRDQGLGISTSSRRCRSCRRTSGSANAPAPTWSAACGPTGSRRTSSIRKRARPFARSSS